MRQVQLTVAHPVVGGRKVLPHQANQILRGGQLWIVGFAVASLYVRRDDVSGPTRDERRGAALFLGTSWGDVQHRWLSGATLAPLLYSSGRPDQQMARRLAKVCLPAEIARGPSATSFMLSYSGDGRC